MLNNSSSIIDHFYSNQPQNSITVKVLVSDLTDHNPLLAWIKKPSISRTPPTKFSRRDMNSFSSEDFVDDLGRKLNSLTMHDDVNVTYDAFINTFMSVLNDHAPLRECTRREANLKRNPWITKNLRRIIQKKNSLYKKSIKSKNPKHIEASKKLSTHLTKLKKNKKGTLR